VIKYLVILILSLTAAPLLTLGVAHSVNEDAHHFVDEVLCKDLPPTPDLVTSCAELEHVRILRLGATAALVAAGGIAGVYLLLAYALGRNRDALARYFPFVVRATIASLAALLALHGLLLLGSVYALGTEHLNRGMLYIGILGSGLLFAAFLIVAGWRNFFSAEPPGITGVVVDEAQAPMLFERVRRIAAQLRATAPARLIIGLQPTAFVVADEINLHDTGTLAEAETLYLSAVALRALTDPELDAVIGHELGHFRGNDLQFSRRFVPAFRSLAVCIHNVSTDDPNEYAWFRMARLPAVSALAGMFAVLTRAVARIRRERELEADGAAAELGDRPALISALVKFAILEAQWSHFQRGIGALANEGWARQDLVTDYLTRTQRLVARTNLERLVKGLLLARLSHPFDSHPTIVERAQKLQVSAEETVASTLGQLAAWNSDSDARTDSARALDIAVSSAETEWLRRPGQPLKFETRPELPLALDLPPIMQRGAGAEPGSVSS
jgi:Zn-dependent protease with chaperone function